MGQLNVHLLPSLVDPTDLAGSCVVVIDVLRASTTICHALANGATRIEPFAEIEAARTRAAELPEGLYLLAGERGGVKIDGFDLGNSPREVTPDVVNGKTILFTTTNGTRALAHATTADEVLIGCFSNASAVAAHVAGKQRVDILCAGTDGAVTLEDVAAAGAIVTFVQEMFQRAANSDAIHNDAIHNVEHDLNDGAQMAAACFRGGDELADTLRQSHGGRNLTKLGYDADIELAARIDTHSIVPRYDARAAAIIGARPENAPPGEAPA